MAEIVTSGGFGQPGPPGPPGPSGDAGSLKGVPIDSAVSNPPAGGCLYFNGTTGKWEVATLDMGTF